MKKLLTILSILSIAAIPAISMAAITRVQHCENNSGGGLYSSISCDLTGVSAENTIVVSCMQLHGFYFLGVSDTASDTFAFDASSTGYELGNPNIQESVEVWRSSYPTAGDETITCNIEGNGHIGINAVEYSGISKSSPLDTYSGNNGNNEDTLGTGLVGTNASDDVIFMSTVNNGYPPPGVIKINPFFTMIHDGSSDYTQNIQADYITSGVVNVNATSTGWDNHNSNAIWAAIGVAYRSAAVAPAPSVSKLLPLAVPTDTAPDTLGFIGGQFSDPGTYLLILLIVGVPLAFYLVKKIKGAIPK
jgi:hypothetical protein